ncbi:hypothetical protein QOZ80_4AG0301510 [Eleusine coracana subsp. coracana]|nr:hypothetical protein QOZ80_4AG0301510 [Eleusine coracana subsp. coracana]
MLELGGMVASAVLKVVTKQICSAIAGDIKLQGAFKKNLSKMKMTLESVEALLKDAERRSIQDAAVCLWLKRLKNALYDIYDMIDEFDASTKPAEGKLLSLVPDVKICSRISMSNKMKKMREELENITNQHQHFSFKIDNSSFIQTVPDERETDSYLKDQTLIVGRMEEKKKVIDTLSESMTQEVVMLPIYGIGGIGKTTLAKQLSKEESHITQKQIIHNRLGELLAVPEKKIMIVLDDLWENDDFQLEELKAMLKVRR